MCLVWKYGEYYPGQKKIETAVPRIAQACDLSSMHVPMFGPRACLNFFGQGSITKVMSVKVENVTWRFCPFLHLESSDGVLEELLPISTLSYSRTGSCSPSAFYALSQSLSKSRHAFCRARGWQLWPLSRSFCAGPAKWGENNSAKMTSQSRKKFPVRVLKRHKTSQNHTSLLQELDCCRFEPKRRFWAAFRLPGTRNKWMYYRDDCNLHNRLFSHDVVIRWKPVQSDGCLDWLHFDTSGFLNNCTCS